MKRVPVLLLLLSLVLLFILFLMPPPVRAQESPDEPETIRVLLDSRAYRNYTTEPVRQEDLDAIIACGLRSPSVVNAQPWHFTVVRNRDAADKIIETNGVVIVISVLPGSGLEDIDEMVSIFDCGLATQAMYTAAQALGLGANIFWAPVAHVKETMREELSIPDDYRILMIMTVGHVDMDAVSSATSRNDAGVLVNYID